MVLLRHIEILKDHTPKRLKSSHFYKNKNKKPVIIFQLCIYFSFFWHTNLSKTFMIRKFKFKTVSILRDPGTLVSFDIHVQILFTFIHLIQVKRKEIWANICFL